MSFAWPWVFLVLPLPWLVRRLATPVEEAGAALRLPSLPAGGVTGASVASRLSLGLALVAWALLVTAAARPQVVGDGAPPPVSGRGLMLAFDVSASMATTDLRLDGRPIDRLRAARTFADEFLGRRQGDRIGLIVFGSQAYLHTPLTFDLEAVRQALSGAEVGLAGRETALGDAVALAVKHLQGLPEQERVLVILTDGANTAGTLTPQRATWLARREGVRIHTVAIGSAGSASSSGEEALRSIAEQSGGFYLRATDGSALADFWQRLGSIEPAGVAAAGLRAGREIYVWPLGLALVIVACLLGMRCRGARA